VAAGLPLVATLLALGCALGVITLISHLVDTPDFATQLATLIGLGVGIDYSLFVVTRYRAEVRAGRDRDAAIEKAIDTAGRTVMFAAITVVIALLGLLLLGLSFMHGVALGAAATVLAGDVLGADDHPGADRGLGPVHGRRACTSSTTAAAFALWGTSGASTCPAPSA
jgi:RND superfamily putative drug exporter